MNRKLYIFIVMVVYWGSFCGASNTVSYEIEMGPETVIVHDKKGDLREALAKLWQDHDVWTRNYIISALADLPDLDAVTQRLLQNQIDIGSAIKPFYGNQAGDKLAALLKEHILIAADVIKAAKQHNKEALDKNNKKWHKNADDIALFLSSANKYWPEKTIKDMLHQHLAFVTGEVTSRLQGNWQEDINFYDKNNNHMIEFSNMLVEGIEKQFPSKF